MKTKNIKTANALLFSVFFIYPLFLAGEPWGKDADLASYRTGTQRGAEKYCETPCLGKFAEAMIKFHQKVISPADGPRSHFIPSSSQYALNAMRKYGFFKGFVLGCDRLMRENNDPWIYRMTRDGAGNLIKFDPVP
jgi:putative component of membrane protein insertase Oxa1/YidC/SpoIIIJ protein YidD